VKPNDELSPHLPDELGQIGLLAQRLLQSSRTIGEMYSLSGKSPDRNCAVCTPTLNTLTVGKRLAHWSRAG